MKVLITGGCGFIGSHLADAFVARGDQVVVLDNGLVEKVRHLIDNPAFRLVHESIFNAEVLEEMIAESDLIYHLAAVVGVEHYVSDPLEVLDVNVNGTQILLKLAFKHRKRAVFGSTSEVYGRNPKIPWREDDDRVLGSTRIDRWCYSTSKAVGEHFCLAYGKMGLPITIVRYFNLYGPRLDSLDGGRVITTFLGQALRGEPLTVIGDGHQTRCFTYITDAIHATVAAGIAPAAAGEIFNVGIEAEHSIAELARRIIVLTGCSSSVLHLAPEQVYGSSYEDIPRRVPDVAKMHRILGVRAEVQLDEGLQHTIDWFRRPYKQHSSSVGP